MTVDHDMFLLSEIPYPAYILTLKLFVPSSYFCIRKLATENKVGALGFNNELFVSDGVSLSKMQESDCF